MFLNQLGELGAQRLLFGFGHRLSALCRFSRGPAPALGQVLAPASLKRPIIPQKIEHAANHLVDHVVENVLGSA